MNFIAPPISRLPVEIISEVMRYATVGEDAMSVLATPWRIACVCVSWRCVSLACPEIWSNITVISYMLGNPRINRRLQEVLSWSGKHPLHVTLAVASEATINYYELQAKKRLWEEAHRFASLALHALQEPRLFISPLKFEMPNLQSISLIIRDSAKYAGTPPLDLSSCTHLTEFRWLGGEAYHTHDMGVPWHRITSFVVSSFNYDNSGEVANLISRCTALQNVTSTCKDTSEFYERFGYYLQSSCGAKSLNTDLGGLLAVLDFPQLCELVLRRSTKIDSEDTDSCDEDSESEFALSSLSGLFDPPKDNDHWLLSQFKDLLSRSNHATTITSLSLVQIRLDHPKYHPRLLARLLQIVNLSVLNLDLDLRTSSPLFLPYEHVVAWLRKPGCLPVLSSFSYTMRLGLPTVQPQGPYLGFVIKHGRDHTLTKFVDTVHSRWCKPGSQLKRFHLDIARSHLYWDPSVGGLPQQARYLQLRTENADRLRIMRDRGVDLRVSMYEGATDFTTNVERTIFSVQWPPNDRHGIH